MQKKKKKGGLECTKVDFPGGPLVETASSSVGGVGSTPGLGAQIPHASQSKIAKHKTEANCNKFNKDLKKRERTKKFQNRDNLWLPW